ncbi:SLC13 family permease [Aerococcus suis]|uniref:Na+/H+ antiporter NhaD n=1 Tax=Aerococcus suis TaxID=371602 RepID=A0A1W1Z1V6_9LACT|nr:SLC13 family permease [Aerococcus suis]SMC42366.1 Na+/H+ antiporter NhaD [Aerococcus suis]
MRTIWRYMTSDRVFLVAFILAVVAILFGQFAVGDINFNVIFTLFGMMLVLALFEASGFLRYAAILLIEKSKDTRQLIQIITLVSFIGSTLLSNDVVTLTILPLYCRILMTIKSFKGRILGATLIPLAANLGGLIFPFSNPQNLVIYDFFQMDGGTFIRWTLPLWLVSLPILYFLTLFVEKADAASSLKQQGISRHLAIYGVILMLLMVASVFGVLKLSMAFPIVAIAVLIINYHLYRGVDDRLLLTFVCFFIIVGNISRLETIQTFLERWVIGPYSTYFVSFLSSQVVSNVPTAILLTPFTDNIQALLLGVNIGGLGTLIASLTNLLGYNIISKMDKPFRKRYLTIFLGVNFAVAVVLTLVFLPFI